MMMRWEGGSVRCITESVIRAICAARAEREPFLELHQRLRCAPERRSNDAR
jgi:hypothetical protein